MTAETKTRCAAPGCPMDAKGDWPVCTTHLQLTPARLRGQIKRCRETIVAALSRKTRALEYRPKVATDEAAAVVAARGKA